MWWTSPSKWPNFMAFLIGVILATYESWDDPPSSCLCFGNPFMFHFGAPNRYELPSYRVCSWSGFFCDEGRINIGKHMLQGYVIPGYVTGHIGFILKNCFGEGEPCVKLPKIIFLIPVHYFCGKVDQPNPPWKPKRFPKELMILTHMETWIHPLLVAGCGSETLMKEIVTW